MNGCDCSQIFQKLTHRLCTCHGQGPDNSSHAGGELFGLIRKTRRFPENDARYFFQQIVCGMEYLHTSGVTHRDIKLEVRLLANATNTHCALCFVPQAACAVEQSVFPMRHIMRQVHTAASVSHLPLHNGCSIYHAIVS